MPPASRTRTTKDWTGLGCEDPCVRAGTRARADQQGDARPLRRARHRSEEPLLERGRRASRPRAPQGRARGPRPRRAARGARRREGASQEGTGQEGCSEEGTRQEAGREARRASRRRGSRRSRPGASRRGASRAPDHRARGSRRSHRGASPPDGATSLVRAQEPRHLQRQRTPAPPRRSGGTAAAATTARCSSATGSRRATPGSCDARGTSLAAPPCRRGPAGTACSRSSRRRCCPRVALGQGDSATSRTAVVGFGQAHPAPARTGRTWPRSQPWAWSRARAPGRPAGWHPQWWWRRCSSVDARRWPRWSARRRWPRWWPWWSSRWWPRWSSRRWSRWPAASPTPP
jgi:hypothetical protein